MRQSFLLEPLGTASTAEHLSNTAHSVLSMCDLKQNHMWAALCVTKMHGLQEAQQANAHSQNQSLG